jgi:hypothetical protein
MCVCVRACLAGLDPASDFHRAFAAAGAAEEEEQGGGGGAAAGVADAGNVMVICHPTDGVIPLAASLYVGLGLSQSSSATGGGGGGGAISAASAAALVARRKVKTMVLSDIHPNAHMVPLDHNEQTWFSFLEVASRLLYRG